MWPGTYLGRGGSLKSCCLAISLDDRPREYGLAHGALPISAVRVDVARVPARDDPCSFSLFVCSSVAVCVGFGWLVYNPSTCLSQVERIVLSTLVYDPSSHELICCFVYAWVWLAGV